MEVPTKELIESEQSSALCAKIAIGLLGIMRKRDSES